MFLHPNIPAINESNPNTSRNNTSFLTLRAFSLDGFLNKKTEHQTSPMSVTKTKGTNHKETKSKITGIGDRVTAKIKNTAAANAARLPPKETARVRIP